MKIKANMYVVLALLSLYSSSIYCCEDQLQNLTDNQGDSKAQKIDKSALFLSPLPQRISFAVFSYYLESYDDIKLLSEVSKFWKSEISNMINLEMLLKQMTNKISIIDIAVGYGLKSYLRQYLKKNIDLIKESTIDEYDLGIESLNFAANIFHAAVKHSKIDIGLEIIFFYPDLKEGFLEDNKHMLKAYEIANKQKNFNMWRWLNSIDQTITM